MNRVIDVIVVLLGVVLLLPGLCSIVFLGQFFVEPYAIGSDFFGMLLVIMIPAGIGLVIAAAGIWLIRTGFGAEKARQRKAEARAPRQDSD